MRPLIYTPSGRAGEYSNHGYAANLYSGCTHGCKYCYAPSVLHVDREVFHSSVKLVPDALARLEADMKRVGKLPEPIFLCFTCDPYCGKGPFSHGDITRDAIDIITKYGNKVNILTKGGTRAIQDFGTLERSDSMIGATLTFLDPSLSQEWEPNAALPEERTYMLRCAHESGIETWASIEPVIIPEQSLAIMELAMPFVDTFKIGKLNHNKLSKEIDWVKFYRDANELMVKNNKKVIFKIDLLKAAGVI